MAELVEHDSEADLTEQMSAAREARTSLDIRGGGTKGFYGNPARAAQVLDVSVHQGVVAYEPTELAITVRAGTPLATVEALLAQHDQELPFEPPHFGPAATVGGMVAAGLSGPRRPYAASVRDAVLGVRLLNGEGKAMDFGGRVMKNVAGYDLSRLMAGSLGILGVLLNVSLKVAPVPVGRMTLVQEQTLDGALVLLKRWARRALPFTGTAWLDGKLYVRLGGSEEGLKQTHQIVGGLPMPDADAFWTDLREQRLAFFDGDAPLWRLSVRPATPATDLRIDGAGEPLVEWGGALRWVRGELPAEQLRDRAKTAGGHATLFRPGRVEPPADGVFTPLEPVVARLHHNLKQAFDPAGILNPGRLYPDL